MVVIQCKKAGSGEAISTPQTWGSADTLHKVLQWVATALGNRTATSQLTLTYNGHSWTEATHGARTLESLGLVGGTEQQSPAVVVEVAVAAHADPTADQLADVSARIIDLFQGGGGAQMGGGAMRAGHRSRHMAPPHATSSGLSPTIDGLEQGPEFEAVNENLIHALQFAPEHFAPVAMLYIRCEINDHSLVAFVDTGAQCSIISKKLADRCSIGHLVDTRKAFTGIAVGVGEQKVIGRVHMVPVKMGTLFVPFSFSVMETLPFDVLIGLDQLLRHQMVVSLKTGRLEVESVSIPFMSEWELQEANKQWDGAATTAAAAAAERAKDAVKKAVADHSANEEEENPREVVQTPPAQVAPPAVVSPPTTTTAAGTADSKEELIQQLMAFTGIADAQQARELLEVTEWDLSTAAEIFFEG